MVAAVKIQNLDVIVNVKVKTDELAKDEVTEVLGSAVRHELDMARTRRDEFLQECQSFETKYHLSSDEFLKQFESGKLGDDADFFTWLFAKESFDKLDRRYQILLGVSL